MTKADAIKALVKIKVQWWSIAENREYTAEQIQDLANVLWKSDKESILKQIECYEARIANVKAKLEAV